MKQLRPLVTSILIVLSASTCTLTSDGSQSPLTSVINEAWEFEKRENPLFATTTNDHRYDAELPSMTPANLARREDSLRAYIERLEAVDTVGLSVSDRINRAMLHDRLENWLASLTAEEDRVPILADDDRRRELSRSPAASAALLP